jgi:hypothetical protein
MRAHRTPEDDVVQAGFLACGSQPRTTFPETRMSPVAHWSFGSPPTVAGAAPDWPAARAANVTGFPFCRPKGQHTLTG